MFRRLWVCFALLVATLALATAVAAAEPASKAAPRIVAVGDLHGDYAAWRDIARAAHLINEQGRWVGGKTVFVQTGDVADRGADTLKIILDLMRLQSEARRAGGQVVALVGNHEAMNVTDDLRYVSAGEYAAFADRNSERVREATYEANKTALEAAYRQRDPAMTSDAVKQAWLAVTPLGMLEHRAAWHPPGKIGRWVIGNPAVFVLDGNLFVHGGISAAYANSPVADLNQRVAAALTAGETARGSIINDPMGPLWYRGLIRRDAAEPAASDSPPAEAATAPATPPPLSIQEELDLVLHSYGVKRIVVGHTPILSGIAVVESGRLVRIDTGISAHYGGKLSYLEIIDGNLVPHIVERSTP